MEMKIDSNRKRPAKKMMLPSDLLLHQLAKLISKDSILLWVAYADTGLLSAANESPWTFFWAGLDIQKQSDALGLHAAPGGNSFRN